MDIKILNKDTIVKKNGYPEVVSGIEQAIQQINIGINMPKGSFIYDRNAGVFTEKLSNTQDNLESTVEILINEALVSSDIYVKVNYVENKEDKLYAGITVTDKYSETDTEVMLNG